LRGDRWLGNSGRRRSVGSEIAGTDSKSLFMVFVHPMEVKMRMGTIKAKRQQATESIELLEKNLAWYSF
jgi:hypothetical protein